jgi:hypothetical protein
MGKGKLLCEMNTPDVEDLVIDAFLALIGEDMGLEGDDINAVFEHDQWWVSVPSTGAQWSVIDAVGDPSTVCNGLSFEQVSMGDES